MIRTAGDATVAGAEVRLIGGQLSALSDAQGRFRLAGVRRGGDRVAVTGRGYETLVLPPLTFPGCGVIRLEVVLGAPQLPPELHPLPQPPPGMIIHVQRQPDAPIVIVDDRIAGRGASVPDLTGLAIAKIQYVAPAQADSLYGSRAARGAYVIETGPRRDCGSQPQEARATRAARPLPRTALAAAATGTPLANHAGHLRGDARRAPACGDAGYRPCCA